MAAIKDEVLLAEHKQDVTETLSIAGKVINWDKTATATIYAGSKMIVVYKCYWKMAYITANVNRLELWMT